MLEEDKRLSEGYIFTNGDDGIVFWIKIYSGGFFVVNTDGSELEEI